MEKTFKFAGVARNTEVGNQYRMYVTNSADRMRNMENVPKFNNIDMIELIHPMTKEAAAQYLLTINFAAGEAEVEQCLNKVLGLGKSSNTRAKPVKVDITIEQPQTDGQTELERLKAKQAKQQAFLDDIRARLNASRAPKLDDCEDAPF